MPNYKSHLTGGLVAAGILLYFMSWWLSVSAALAVQLVLCALFGSLFPDIDTKSQGQLLSYRFLGIVLIVLILQQRVVLALACSAVGILPLIVHHRGLFHRAWFIAAVCIGIVTYAYLYQSAYLSLVVLHAVFFFVGALSHIWLDVGIKRMFRV
ncbi:MAG: metal-dependent hydrolase [Candidatus Babeliales bacterium]